MYISKDRSRQNSKRQQPEAHHRSTSRLRDKQNRDSEQVEHHSKQAKIGQERKYNKYNLQLNTMHNGSSGCLVLRSPSAKQVQHENSVALNEGHIISLECYRNYIKQQIRCLSMQKQRDNAEVDLLCIKIKQAYQQLSQVHYTLSQQLATMNSKFVEQVKLRNCLQVRNLENVKQLKIRVQDQQLVSRELRRQRQMHRQLMGQIKTYNNPTQQGILSKLRQEKNRKQQQIQLIHKQIGTCTRTISNMRTHHQHIQSNITHKQEQAKQTRLQIQTTIKHMKSMGQLRQDVHAQISALMRKTKQLTAKIEDIRNRIDVANIQLLKQEQQQAYLTSKQQQLIYELDLLNSNIHNEQDYMRKLQLSTDKEALNKQKYLSDLGTLHQYLRNLEQANQILQAGLETHKSNDAKQATHIVDRVSPRKQSLVEKQPKWVYTQSEQYGHRTVSQLMQERPKYYSNDLYKQIIRQEQMRKCTQRRTSPKRQQITVKKGTRSINEQDSIIEQSRHVGQSRSAEQEQLIKAQIQALRHKQLGAFTSKDGRNYSSVSENMSRQYILREMYRQAEQARVGAVESTLIQDNGIVDQEATVPNNISNINCSTNKNDKVDVQPQLKPNQISRLDTAKQQSSILHAQQFLQTQLHSQKKWMTDLEVSAKQCTSSTFSSKSYMIPKEISDIISKYKHKQKQAERGTQQTQQRQQKENVHGKYSSNDGSKKQTNDRTQLKSKIRYLEQIRNKLNLHSFEPIDN